MGPVGIASVVGLGVVRSIGPAAGRTGLVAGRIGLLGVRIGRGGHCKPRKC